MKTNLCHVLGIEHPIIAAPMGPDLTGPELVAAVSNAGGLGILQAQFCTPPVFRQEIRRVRALTARPFGVNLLLHFPVADQVAICLEEQVPVLSLFWGDPAPYVGRAHAAGVKVFHQVGSVADARRAAAAWARCWVRCFGASCCPPGVNCPRSSQSWPCRRLSPRRACSPWADGKS